MGADQESQVGESSVRVGKTVAGCSVLSSVLCFFLSFSFHFFCRYFVFMVTGWREEDEGQNGSGGGACGGNRRCSE